MQFFIGILIGAAIAVLVVFGLSWKFSSSYKRSAVDLQLLFLSQQIRKYLVAFKDNTELTQEGQVTIVSMIIQLGEVIMCLGEQDRVIHKVRFTATKKELAEVAQLIQRREVVRMHLTSARGLFERFDIERDGDDAWALNELFVQINHHINTSLAVVRGKMTLRVFLEQTD